MSDLDEVIEEFLVESYENLDRIDRDVLELERDAQGGRLDRIFRAVHTVKGTCGFLGYTTLESVAHAGESLLSGLRDGRVPVTPHVTDALLATVDAIRKALSAIQRTGTDDIGDQGALIATLARLHTAPAAPVESPADVRTDPLPLPDAVADPAGRLRGGVRGETSVRVDVGLLDDLGNLAGELVLVRDQVLRQAKASADPSLLSAAHRLDRITGEVADRVARTRRQPIGAVWAKLPRLVRDLSAACGKQVRIETSGEDTRLDKAIVEAIKDPLTHIVRNSLDHGIEQPADRIAAGKPAEGTLALRAFQQAGSVIVEITDDGAGIDQAALLAQAVQRGFVAAGEAAAMTHRQVLDLVFAPGLSTAAEVTNVSGRGVGMDVVKTNVGRLGGVVGIGSQQGIGTTLTITIPLTLATVPALTVSSGGQRYAIPQATVFDIVRLDGEEARRAGAALRGARTRRRRSDLPLTTLDEASTRPDTPLPGVVNLIVVQAHDGRFGLVVDEVGSTEQIVVRPLGPRTAPSAMFAGVATMDDGCAALVVDVLRLAEQAKRSPSPAGAGGARRCSVESLVS